MIKFSALYPNTEGSEFDMEYYTNRHIPLVQERLGAACKGVAIEAGLGGLEPGSPPTYVVMGHLYFDSLEAFQTAFAPYGEELAGDIPNFTNVQPVIQLSEVKL